MSVNERGVQERAWFTGYKTWFAGGAQGDPAARGRGSRGECLCEETHVFFTPCANHRLLDTVAFLTRHLPLTGPKKS